MNFEKDPIIGLVGGMGPQAGLALFNNILCLTNATTDQQHLSVMLMSFPQHIVDRTAFLEGSTSINPAYTIAAIIQKMEKAGASIIGIACNTSYSPAIFDVILEELEKFNSRITLLHMPLETCRYIREHYPQVQRVGLMTTNGTYRSQVYKNLLLDQGYEVIQPDYAFQHEVIHTMIYDQAFGLKSNPSAVSTEARALMDKAIYFFKEHKTDAIILGCTELSLVVTQKRAGGMLVIDSTQSLARALIREAGVKILHSQSKGFKSPT